MTNGKSYDPEYRVNCLMCNQSFSATADTLGELVEIVAVHLRRVEELDNMPHEAYFKKNPEEKELLETLLARYHNDPSEIVRSKFFSWDVLRLVPYIRIFEVVKIPLPTRGAPQTSMTKPAREQTASLKVP